MRNVSYPWKCSMMCQIPQVSVRRDYIWWKYAQIHISVLLGAAVYMRDSRLHWKCLLYLTVSNLYCVQSCYCYAITAVFVVIHKHTDARAEKVTDCYIHRSRSFRADRTMSDSTLASPPPRIPLARQWKTRLEHSDTSSVT